eukprot:COSAG05_NODE_150_length_16171_cov_64.740356_9_plen_159_part_00
MAERLVVEMDSIEQEQNQAAARIQATHRGNQTRQHVQLNAHQSQQRQQQQQPPFRSGSPPSSRRPYSPMSSRVPEGSPPERRSVRPFCDCNCICGTAQSSFRFYSSRLFPGFWQWHTHLPEIAIYRWRSSNICVATTRAATTHTNVGKRTHVWGVCVC